MAQQGRIVKVAGPLIGRGKYGGRAYVRCRSRRKNRLVGEVIELRGDKASIQVYEETSGLGPGRTGGIHRARRFPWNLDQG